MGRINFGVSHDFIQDKGIGPAHQSKIELNNEEIRNVQVFSAEFENAWVAK